MTAWRAIFTDSESMSGVAPVCEHQDDVSKHSTGDGHGKVADPHGVYDCCPGPHLEMWSEQTAAQLAATLTAADAQVCS
jgi:hypothetical protein